jgi:hypothetical protein
VDQCLGLGALTAKGAGSIPGGETKILYAMWHSQKSKCIIKGVFPFDHCFRVTNPDFLVLFFLIFILHTINSYALPGVRRNSYFILFFLIFF